MDYQNEMVDKTKVMEVVLPYINWMQERQPDFSASTAAKVKQDSLKSHKNSHDR